VQALGSLAGIEYQLGEVESAVEHYRAAAEHSASIGFAWWELGARGSLSHLFLELDRVGDARLEGLRALELARRIGDRGGAVSALATFALLASRTGDAERAGALWGAIEAEVERKPLALWTAEQREAVEAQLPHDDPEFARGRARGRLLAREEAMDEVRASLD
jgi:hypothetical protein